MYIDYSRLWKLLIDKGITKTELSALTGISSRVIAKLSKNQTVTTDTLARICEVLDCKIEDMMECVSESRLSLYEHYRKYGKVTDENELTKRVEFEKDGQKYVLYITRAAVTKSTHIHCRADGSVYREDLYPFGGYTNPSRVESVLIKPQRKADETVIVVIKGKPGVITGLDEGIFVSSRGRIKTKNDIYVMSEAAFKLFGGQK